MSTNAHRWFGAFILLTAGALLALAAAALPARLAALGGDALRDPVLNSAVVSDQDFKRFIASRLQASTWHSFADYDDELAAAYAERATRAKSDSEARRYDSQALEFQRQALRLQPADAYGWAQLAFLTARSENDPAQAIEPLRLSIATAPYEPALMPSRLDLMIGLASYLSDEERQAILVVAQDAWRADPYLTAVTAAGHHYLDIVAQALQDDEAENARFHKLVADEKLR